MSKRGAIGRDSAFSSQRSVATHPCPARLSHGSSKGSVSSKLLFFVLRVSGPASPASGNGQTVIAIDDEPKDLRLLATECMSAAVSASTSLGRKNPRCWMTAARAAWRPATPRCVASHREIAQVAAHGEGRPSPPGALDLQPARACFVLNRNAEDLRGSRWMKTYPHMALRVSGRPTPARY